ncbi:endothelin-converting enzyme 1, partial [Plakobranchus ocellatus]
DDMRLDDINIMDIIADFNGLIASFAAYKDENNKAHFEKKYIQFHGQTLQKDQLFFLAFAQTNCRMQQTLNLIEHTLYRPVLKKMRVNQPLISMLPFGKAFACRQGTRMNPKQKCVSSMASSFT